MQSLIEHPTATATPCPSWCKVGDDHEPGDRYHQTGYDWTGPLGLGVEITEEQVPVLAVSLGNEPGKLSLSDVDELIAQLAEKRSLLAEITAGVAR